MKNILNQASAATDIVIEQLIEVSMSHVVEHRHQYALREALRALVRLAKAEKLLEIRRDTALALGINTKDQR